MNKKILLAVLIVIIIIVIVLYYVVATDVSSKFEFKQGMDIFGFDMPQVNNEFKASGKTTLKDAMTFALTRKDTVGFVKLNSGEILFKSTKPVSFTPCINNLCALPDSGLYLKK